MKRDIIKIDEELCDGCGLCVPNCHEGALKIINGKAKLVSEVLCDGLGACLGHCPQGAITIESRDAEPFDETVVTMKEEYSHSHSHSEFKDQPSELRHWPVQLHLINPNAAFLKEADLLLAADCVAFASGNFHSKYLKGRSLAIACPKLDQGTNIYIEKLTTMIDHSRINTITVMMMEVPCCGGLLHMVKTALERASRKVPVKKIIISLSGQVLQEEWM
ncbi:MAG TPA: 4Fe-4S binding protein [Bacteroidales bacterium]|jgi:ferredoxin|nr:4Fe-4S ferredoxin [Bacteroidales bacterium]OQB59836.1 MAG: ferredoxin [Bacteroidetes bacterium ADurb.Bin145]HOU02722.1 4Fe-4S binding protein [Bacteroidales bacterium]HQG62542.1 4Fe-4S binding protein [Bacteroidales bacterium]HQK68545.1 4Fe-4S binding protein [Bacteroidales bacterium]